MSAPQNPAAFVAVLRSFADANGDATPDGHGRIGYRPMRGTCVLVRALATWLEEAGIDHSPHMDWMGDMPALVVAAFEDFRVEQRWETARRLYGADPGGDIPDLLDLRCGTSRALVALELARLIPILADRPWLAAKLEGYFSAPSDLVDQAWARFARRAFPAVQRRIRTERHRSNVGTFGATTLETFDCAGRILFGFSRGDTAVTYIAATEDPTGRRAGAQHYQASAVECVTLIDDVTSNWDLDKLREAPP